MIVPVLKNLWSSDLERPNVPEDPENCTIDIQIKIGTSASEAAEDFQLKVVTPPSLMDENFLWGRHVLVVSEFKWNAVESIIEERVRRCQGEDWKGVSEKLRRYFYSEYEDYNG